jgi:uncharacterized delta-60 repeat protein
MGFEAAARRGAACASAVRRMRIDVRELPARSVCQPAIARAMVVLLLFCSVFSLASPTAAQSPIDGFDPDVADGAVKAVAVDPADGRLLIGGSFSGVGGTARPALVRLRIDGSVDLGFNGQIGAGSTVESIVALAEGGFLVAGGLTSVAGQSRGNLVKIGPFAVLDDTFDPAVDGVVQVAVEDTADPDAPRIYIGGTFENVGGQPRTGIARLHADGSLDAGFDPPDFTGAVYAVMPLPDGGVLVGGYLAEAGQPLSGRLFRLDDEGAIDEDFLVDMDVSAGQATVRSIARQVDGLILVAGNFDTVNGQPRSRIVRIDGDGLIDPGYVPANLSSTIFSVALQPDGRALIVGNFSGAGGRDRIARLMHDGSLDDTFDAVSANSQLYSAVVQDDGALVVAGTFTDINGIQRNRVARLSPDGELEQTLTAMVSEGAVFAVAGQPDGRIVLGGAFGSVDGQEHEHLVRLNADGSIDSAFQAEVNRDVAAVVVLADERLVIAGDFNAVDNESAAGIARLLPTGAMDTTFVGDLGAGSATAMAVQPDGRLIVGVSVPPARGSSESLLRLDADGSVDGSFPEIALDGRVHAIALMLEGRIVIGGEFTQIDGVGRNRIARLLADGSLDPEFNPGANGTVWSLSVNFNGSTFVGGDFTQIDGQPHSRFARLADNGNVFGTAIDADDRVSLMLSQRGNFTFIGGAFENIGFQPRSRLALLAGNSLGAYDGAIGPGTLWSGAIQSDGKLLVGGDFFEVGGEERSSIARLTGFSAVRQSLAWSPVDGLVSWTTAGSLSEPKSTPQLLMSTTCCDRMDFAPLPGEMYFSGNGWSYDGFPELDGVFYLRVRARVGDGKGAGSGLFESPIYQFVGSGPDGIFADDFEGAE